MIMQQMPNQQVQTHQVVEEIMQDQMSEEVTKEVINQFLPQRKRKPRVKKPNQNASKMIKLEPQTSQSTIIQTINTQSNPIMTESEIIEEEDIQQQQQQEIGEIGEIGEIVGEDGQMTTVKTENGGKISIKSEKNSKKRHLRNNVAAFSNLNIFLLI